MFIPILKYKTNAIFAFLKYERHYFDIGIIKI